MILLLIGTLVFSVGVFIAMENASVSRKQIQANIRRAGSYASIAAEEGELGKSARERLITPMVERFTGLAIRMSPAGKRVELQRKLRNAGTTARPQTLLAIKGALAAVGVGLIVLGALTGSLPVLMIGLLSFMIGFLGPDFWLNSRIRRRRDAMERAMPDTLDLLTVSVEAGLGFDAAVSKVCEKMDGPLIEEFDMVAREIRVGETRRQALRNFGDRVDSEDVRSFSRSIIQADELGTSLGRTLKVQADDMRVHRQLKAEEKAMKAPVKMLFPTVMFIFPAMFIIILGPAFLNIMSALANTSS
ncbi:MAG: type secretion system protein [Thermoleophilia bacterium]|nr:type secretion system protein [Thermoleophilia bacterium]